MPLGIPDKIKSSFVLKFYVKALRFFGLAKPTFEGPYPLFFKSENGDLWISATRIKFTRDRLQKLKSEINSKSFIANWDFQETLPQFITFLSGILNPSIPFRVLDFGGGDGNVYLATTSSLNSTESLFWHVVDSKVLTDQGKEICSEFKNLSFSSELPQQSFDLIFINSVLQFVESPYSLLEQLLIKYPTKYIFLGRLMAGDYPTTFYKQLNVGEKPTGAAFLNLNEFMKIFDKFGYKIIAKLPAAEDRLSLTSFHNLKDASFFKGSVNIILKKKQS
ncbi:MAG: methyltransferase, TIGR04325 family [Deltaproteobacteria bacterium]|nr:methyltransferase, TIGR04325 family [Deltaproteobacteria bacterium]